MASSKKWNSTLALACSLAVAATAQPTWRFHLAFEDGTGARDTIWFVFDTTATIFDVDSQCGEAGVTLNPDSFHVFMFNQGNDSTQTDAQPYTEFFPSFVSQLFYGMNFQYPLTLSWDTSLFHAPYLPEGGIGGAVLSGEYFWQAGYSELTYGTVDMTFRDSIVLYNIGYPFFGSQLQFWDGNITAGVAARPMPHLKVAISGRSLAVTSTDAIQDIALYNAQGGLLRSTSPNAAATTLDMGELPTAVYLLCIRTAPNQWHHEKLFYASP
jgi:hypothetical protein